MESNKEKFRRSYSGMADSENFIPGIYNYCDCWCERCTLRHKCLNYSREQEMREECNDPGNNNRDNKKFLEQIRLSFEVTLDMIAENSNEFGAKFEELYDEEICGFFENPVEEMATRYGSFMDKWLIENGELLLKKANQLLSIRDQREQAMKFADAVEVVQWYCYYIRAKIYRSFFKTDSRLIGEDNYDDIIADNIGSAKVAIISINKSMEALGILYLQLKDQEDEILDFLRQLSEIKKHMLVTFPTAMEFKRPGFDD